MLLVLGVTSNPTYAQRTCGTPTITEIQNSNPTHYNQLQSIEQNISQNINNPSARILEGDDILIPVVVHVLFNNSTSSLDKAFKFFAYLFFNSITFHIKLYYSISQVFIF